MTEGQDTEGFLCRDGALLSSPMQLLGLWVGLAPPLACSGAVSARNLSLHDTVDEGRVRVSVNMVRGLPALSLA